MDHFDDFPIYMYLHLIYALYVIVTDYYYGSSDNYYVLYEFVVKLCIVRIHRLLRKNLRLYSKQCNYSGYFFTILYYKLAVLFDCW